MVLSVKDLKGEDKAQAAADILAHAIDEDVRLGSPSVESAATVLDPTIETVRERSGLSHPQMQSVLRRLSQMQGARQSNLT